MSAAVKTDSSDEGSSSSSSQKSPGLLMKTTIASLSYKFPSVKNLSTSDLANWLSTPSQRAVVVLDARPEEEYVVSHIEGARRVDFKDENIEQLANIVEQELRGKPSPAVVCYCSLGYRSSAVAKNLQEHYKNSGSQLIPEVYNLAGSLFQWANESRPMFDVNGIKTQFVHPYSPVWGKLLNASLRKSNV